MEDYQGERMKEARMEDNVGVIHEKGVKRKEEL